MANNPKANNEVSQDLDQYIIETVRGQCLQLGVVAYNPTSLRWSWLRARDVTFEQLPYLSGGQLVLFKGLQNELSRDDWPPQLLYSLIRGQKKKGNVRLAFGILAPIVVFLVAVPIFLSSTIDIVVALPVLFSGAAIYNTVGRRQRIAADNRVVETLGKESLLQSLKSLEAYFEKVTVWENCKRISQLATEEYQGTTHLKGRLDLLGDLLAGQNEVRKRIRTLEGGARDRA